MATIIELAGVDGAGKSTLIAGLRGRCARDHGLTTIERRPRLAVNHLWDGAPRGAEAALRGPRFWAGFGEFVSRVVPEVGLLTTSLRPLVVFADGYVLAQLAHGLQALDADDERQHLRELVHHLRVPDMTLVLKIDPGVALERVRARGGYDAVLSARDPADSLRRRQERLLEAARQVRYPTSVVDANARPSALLDDAWQRVAAVLPRAEPAAPGASGGHGP